MGEVFDLYSDRKVRKFPDYDIVGPHLHLKPKESCPVVNFDSLKDLMLSKDLSKLQEFKELINPCKFLDKKVGMPGIAFVSWPRTGNSFLRKIIENVTGIFTGTDMNLEMTRDH